MKLIEGASGPRRRSGIRLEPRTIDAGASVFMSATTPGGVAPETAGKPGAGPRRHGAERRPDPGNGDGKIFAALARRNGRRARRRWEFWTKFWRRCASGDVQKIGAATSRNFHGPIQTIIPWAGNFYTETLIEPRASEFGDGFLGFLDARRNVRRRHGVHFRARAGSRGPGPPAKHHGPDKARIRKRPALSPWSRWFMISPSMNAAPGPIC